MIAINAAKQARAQGLAPTPGWDRHQEWLLLVGERQCRIATRADHTPG